MKAPVMVKVPVNHIIMYSIRKHFLIRQDDIMNPGEVAIIGSYALDLHVLKILDDFSSFAK